jgi:hypothetical protein
MLLFSEEPVQTGSTGFIWVMGTNFGFQPLYGFDPLPPRATFIVTGSFSQSEALFVKPTA